MQKKDINLCQLEEIPESVSVEGKNLYSSNIVVSAKKRRNLLLKEKHTEKGKESKKNLCNNN
ncbi:hypothetical protein HN903_01670 [archaeon]|jgi:hypothetical protein|nr:hypothetical protein [archaeon]MBT7128441.1 hypothetical protein [archaeon]